VLACPAFGSDRLGGGLRSRNAVYVIKRFRVIPSRLAGPLNRFRALRGQKEQQPE